MVDVRRIRGRMVELGMSVATLADHLSLNPASVYRRFNSPEDITVGEAQKIKNVLHFSGAEASEIFFTDESHEMRQ